MGGWIGVDLDGTLAHYEVFKGASIIGAPVPAMVERVKAWLAAGKAVKIFTARVAWPETSTEYIEASEAIRAWCVEHIGQELPITCMKDYGMVELYDDRCVQVEMNTGRLIGQ